MPVSQGTARGKVILSGEYAVLFGHRGVAVPSKQKLEAYWQGEGEGFRVTWNEEIHPAWQTYAEDVARLLGNGTLPDGTLRLENELPLGKGMGSSTALVVAMTRALAGDNTLSLAQTIEDAVNPGHSGIDFAVIWNDTPVVFAKDKVPSLLEESPQYLQSTLLIDTGMPDQSTRELVAWVKDRSAEVQEPLETIGRCTEKLLSGKTLQDIFPEHHAAQVRLGVVTEAAQALIADIETSGGCAKVIGAGGRSGGSGMVLAIGCAAETLTRLASQHGMKTLSD